jgi:ankyrin repeat protein
MLAAQHADLGVVRELIKNHADVNASDKFGNTVLMHALWREKMDAELNTVVQELLAHEADLTKRNKAMKSPSTIARERGLTHLERSLTPVVTASQMMPPLRAGSASARKRKAAF